MTCTRCQGLMVAKPMSHKRSHCLYFLNCINCGNYEDRTIRFNRSQPVEEMRSRRHRSHWTRIQEEVAHYQFAQ